MFIEEKTHMAWPRWEQVEIFKLVHGNAVFSKSDCAYTYYGFWFLVFENEGCEDGRIFVKSIDWQKGVEITAHEYAKRFLLFDMPKENIGYA
jgi:hypothetical protein